MDENKIVSFREYPKILRKPKPGYWAALGKKPDYLAYTINKELILLVSGVSADPRYLNSPVPKLGLMKRNWLGFVDSVEIIKDDITVKDLLEVLPDRDNTGEFWMIAGLFFSEDEFEDLGI